MRLLDRYLLRQLLTPLGYCLGGFIVFWVSFDLFAELDEFQSRRLGAAKVAEYYLAKIPDFLWIVLPVALLLALLYALTDLARHNELTAMRAAGISLWRLCLPYFAVGGFFSMALLGINELWAPQSSARAADIMRGEEMRVQRSLNFQNARDGRIWRVAEYDLRTAEMVRVRVDWDLPDGSVRKLIADRAVRTNGVWVFFNVTEFEQKTAQDLPVTRLTNELAVAEFSETPIQIAAEIKIGSLRNFKASSRVQLSYRELRSYFQWHSAMRPEERAFLGTLMHARLSMPWTCLVVALIAIPFGAPSGRRNAFVGVASSIVICFLYYVVRELSLVLGAGGHLPPPVAAWLPNLVFAGFGLWMTARLR